MKITIWLFIMLKIMCVSTYNILGVFPFSGMSHFTVFQSILKGLQEKGHNLTVLGYYPMKDKLKNYTDVQIGDQDLIYKDLNQSMFGNIQTMDPSSKLSCYMEVMGLAYFGKKTCKMVLESKNVQDIMDTNNNFDIAIVEHFNTDCGLAIAKKFNIPIIRVHSSTFMPWTHGRFGNPLNTAYMPNIFLSLSDKMIFLERVENTLLTLVQSVYFNYMAVRSDDELVSQYLGEDAKTLKSDIYKNSLLLINRHFSLHYPAPLVPNIVEIGGVHIGKVKPLPNVSNASFIYLLVKNFNISFFVSRGPC